MRTVLVTPLVSRSHSLTWMHLTKSDLLNSRPHWELEGCCSAAGI